MNPVLILSYNALHLLKQCVDSVLNQDIPTYLGVIDNGSVDGSPQWLDMEGIPGIHNTKNLGVSAGWNRGMETLFSDGRVDHVLVLNQDVVLPPFFYREMLAKDVPFVTGYPVDSIDTINQIEDWMVPAPCFSAFLIRRECWEKVGPFWEQDAQGNGIFSWCNDCDYHLRAHRLGIRMYKAGIPFWHEGSHTIETASPKEKRFMQLQADADRMAFYERYGFAVGSSQYDAQFSPDNFGIDAK